MIIPVAIDVVDLDTLLLVDRSAALVQLASLTLAQLTLEAYAYAAYYEVEYHTPIDGVVVLAIWNDAIAREGV